MLEIYTLPLTPFQQNTRIVADPDAERAVVIDPGGEVERILAELKKHGLSCAEIWLTHSHLDHCGGVKLLKERTGAELLGHLVEKPLRERVEELCQLYGIPRGVMENSPEPDRYLSGGEEITFGGHAFQVLFTPGHSPGHLSFYSRELEVLFGGDAVFAGSIGRTDIPGADHETLMRSIRTEIYTLPPETRILSGHGPETTVGTERSTNPFVRGR